MVASWSTILRPWVQAKRWKITDYQWLSLAWSGGVCADLQKRVWNVEITWKLVSGNKLTTLISILHVLKQRVTNTHIAIYGKYSLTCTETKQKDRKMLYTFMALVASLSHFSHAFKYKMKIQRWNRVLSFTSPFLAWDYLPSIYNVPVTVRGIQ